MSKLLNVLKLSVLFFMLLLVTDWYVKKIIPEQVTEYAPVHIYCDDKFDLDQLVRFMERDDRPDAVFATECTVNVAYMMNYGIVKYVWGTHEPITGVTFRTLTVEHPLTGDINYAISFDPEKLEKFIDEQESKDKEQRTMDGGEIPFLHKGSLKVSL